MNQRELFLRHVAQTSTAPLALEIVRAEGSRLYDSSGKEYIDLIGGISVANIGHCHPDVVAAIEKQARLYLHVMVYGEFIEAPQVEYAKLLTDHLPAPLDSVYFTNSGAEAVEGAMKLAKRATRRTRIISFNNSYHGSTQGALSIIGSEYWRNAFRPLLPDIFHLDYGSDAALNEINDKTACVVVEAVQAEAGIVSPPDEWLLKLREKCTGTGTLLILDEIQTGFGRTGKLWGFEQAGIVPNILLFGKALGGGMPLGAFIASKRLMHQLTDNPVLGHLTTFGGHPVSCAAGIAAFKVLLNTKILEELPRKIDLFRRLLRHPQILEVRQTGLWFALRFASYDTNKRVIDACIARGLVTDWFLFAADCLRISPPLVITGEEIRAACKIIVEACDALENDPKEI